MKKLMTILCAVLLLNGCGGGSESSGLTPLPDKKEPKDEKLIEAVTNYVQKKGAPSNSDYDFVRVDLNNDGRRDGIVLFKLPHTYWCGWDGCGMLILKANEKDFTPISAVSSIRGPIYVSSESNNGWKDIIIRASGTNMSDRNIKLKFDGSAYPQSPLLGPTLIEPISVLNAQAFFK